MATSLTPVDIAKKVGMSYEDFLALPQLSKLYYFCLVQYGPNSEQFKRILNH